MRKLYLFFAWFLFIAGISLSGFSIFQIGKNQFFNPVIALDDQNQIANIIVTSNNILGYSTIKEDIVAVEDGRAIAIRNFIERYNPQLLIEDPDFDHDLVEIADEFSIDYRLLPAIAMKESGMCRVTPKDSFNCLGLGVHSRGTWHFPSYKDNFAKAAEILKKNYIDIGLVTPEQIMTKYTPSSPGGAWAIGVNQFMTEIKYDDRSKGINESETNHVLELAK